VEHLYVTVLCLALATSGLQVLQLDFPEFISDQILKTFKSLYSYLLFCLFPIMLYLTAHSTAHTTQRQMIGIGDELQTTWKGKVVYLNLMLGTMIEEYRKHLSEDIQCPGRDTEYKPKALCIHLTRFVSTSNCSVQLPASHSGRNREYLNEISY
jgi:hypothetical protein